MITGRCQISELLPFQIFRYRARWYAKGPVSYGVYRDVGYGWGYTKPTGFLPSTRVHAIASLHLGELPQSAQQYRRAG
jgi:hypothetical protein